jgi:hypothetical protein
MITITVGCIETLSEERYMNARMVQRDDSPNIRVDEAGARDGRPVLFIHGYSQSRLSWTKQMNADALADFLDGIERVRSFVTTREFGQTRPSLSSDLVGTFIWYLSECVKLWRFDYLKPA